MLNVLVILVVSCGARKWEDREQLNKAMTSAWWEGLPDLLSQFLHHLRLIYLTSPLRWGWGRRNSLPFLWSGHRGGRMLEDLRHVESTCLGPKLVILHPGEIYKHILDCRLITGQASSTVPIGGLFILPETSCLNAQDSSAITLQACPMNQC